MKTLPAAHLNPSIAPALPKALALLCLAAAGAGQARGQASPALEVSASSLPQAPASSLPDAPGLTAAASQPGPASQNAQPGPAAPSPPPQQQTNPPPPPPAKPLQTRPQQTPEEAAEAVRISKLARINGVPYDQPSTRDTVIAYVKDTYGLNGLVATTVRALYAEARGKPTGWGTDAAGFGQRFGSSAAITVINGNVRLGMELIFSEDLRYLPCNGCSAKRKVENSLLAEITARHDVDGHRFFTLTPTVADFSGPIIAHVLWYPGPAQGPLPGFVSARTVFATRVGLHLLQEFYADPVDKAKKADQKAQKAAARRAAAAAALPPA